MQVGYLLFVLNRGLFRKTGHFRSARSAENAFWAADGSRVLCYRPADGAPLQTVRTIGVVGALYPDAAAAAEHDGRLAL